MNLLESMQTMIRHVKISSFVQSILMVTTAKSVAALTTRKISIRNHVYTCSKCDHQSCLFAGTIFQDCKLDLYKLLLGLFIFFTSNEGVSAMKMRSQLDVNYKTVLLLCRKCRVLMSECNPEKILDNMFYEADVAYIGSRSKEPGHQGCGTEEQYFF